MNYIPPEFKKEAFTCPICRVYSRQIWSECIPKNHIFLKIEIEYDFLRRPTNLTNVHTTIENELSINLCEHCKNYAVWYKEKMIHPKTSIAPFPHKDMPVDIEKDFNEARNILNDSPRAAAALLRLALQKLLIHLGCKGQNTNEDIKYLFQQGLSPKIQKAMDILRVIGNNAVHPGQIDVDNKEIALKLFNLINIIVDEMITRPKEIEEFYQSLPENYKEAIEKRDKKGKE